jgi:Fur family ferric uptake transcriptional regulator
MSSLIVKNFFAKNFRLTSLFYHAKMEQCSNFAKGEIMQRPANYQTKQRQAVLKYIVSLEGAHATAAQIVKHFAQEATPIGRTTVYRHLEKLTADGQIRRYTTDGISGACYQYISDHEDCQFHAHLKCEGCGELQHLECDQLSEIQHHFSASHSFTVDPLKTVFYGKCGECAGKD